MCIRDSNYTISLANVSSSALSSTFSTASLTQVYTQVAHTLVSGNNTYAFGTGSGSSGFTWDGTSNILVNICYTVSGANTSSTVAATTPSFVSNVQLLATSGACTATSGSTFANRPLIAFGYNAFTPYTLKWLDAGNKDVYKRQVQ